MENIEEKISKSLFQKFEIYNKDLTYFQKVTLTTLRKDNKEDFFNKCQRAVLKDIEKSWNTNNIDWFINYLNQGLDSKVNEFEFLHNIFNMLNFWNLKLNIEKLEFILMKCPKFNALLERILSRINPVSEENINRIITDHNIKELVYTYAILQNKLTLEDEVDLSSSVDNFYSDDSVALYRKQAADVAISPEETIDCFIKTNELKEKLKNESLPDEERRKIERKIELLKNKIVEGNLRLVLAIAKKYSTDANYFLDLVQEGNIGLVKAYERYDVNKGYRFSTYATWWVRQTIFEVGANQSRVIQLPKNKLEKIRKLDKAMNKLIIELKGEPNDYDLAQELHMSVEDIVDLKTIALDTTSLESPLPDTDDSTLKDFIPDESEGPEEILEIKSLKETIKSVLSLLSNREEQVLRMRFGIPYDSDLNNKIYNEPHSLMEVGSKFNITRERVRQIENIALKKALKLMNIKGFYGNNQDLNNKGKSFWSYFKDYTKKEVLDKTKKLSLEEKELLHKKFGKDLDLNHKLDKNEEKEITLIINKMKEYLANIFEQEEISLVTYLNCTREEFLIISKILSKKQLDCCTSLFGKNLNDSFSLKGVDRVKQKEIKDVLAQLNVKLKKLRNIEGKTLGEILGILDEDNDYLIQIYNNSNSSIMKLVHGKDFSQTLNYATLLKVGPSNYFKKLSYYKRALKNINNQNRKTLLEVLSCSKDELTLVLTKLDRCHRNLELLKKLFGENLMGVYQKNDEDEKAFHCLLFLMKLKLKEVRGEYTGKSLCNNPLIEDLIGFLPDEYRDVTYLYVWQGVDIKQIAKLLQSDVLDVVTRAKKGILLLEKIGEQAKGISIKEEVLNLVRTLD